LALRIQWHGQQQQHDPESAPSKEEAAMGLTDFIGGRGEAIAFLRLARIWRDDTHQPYFWPRYLGEKGQLFDFLVELVDAGERTPFFFVQVRSTRKAFTKQTPPRLCVEVSQKEVRRTVAYLAPTYVVGIHEGEERAFVIAVHGDMSEAIPSLTTAHELNSGETLRRLWEEVRGFWEGRDMRRTVSSFLN
jgi:hypothetical protein